MPVSLPLTTPDGADAIWGKGQAYGSQGRRKRGRHAHGARACGHRTAAGACGGARLELGVMERARAGVDPAGMDTDQLRSLHKSCAAVRAVSSVCTPDSSSAEQGA